MVRFSVYLVALCVTFFWSPRLPAQVPVGEGYLGNTLPSYPGGISGGYNEQLYPYDNQQPWLHGYFQEIPAYGGYVSFRPYNYKHVLSQTQAAAGWGLSPTMPYSQQFWHRYHEQSRMERLTRPNHLRANAGSSPGMTPGYTPPAPSAPYQQQPYQQQPYQQQPYQQQPYQQQPYQQQPYQQPSPYAPQTPQMPNTLPTPPSPGLPTPQFETPGTNYRSASYPYPSTSELDRTQLAPGRMQQPNSPGPGPFPFQQMSPQLQRVSYQQTERTNTFDPRPR